MARTTGGPRTTRSTRRSRCCARRPRSSGTRRTCRTTCAARRSTCCTPTTRRCGSCTWRRRRRWCWRATGSATFQQMFGKEGGEANADDGFAKRSFENVGAWILGRNMFGPVRGPWPDDQWKGWWGDTPPYHVPVFVLTHHARAPLEMKGGTTFYFVSDGAESALKQAKVAAQGKDVRIGGGVATIRQYLAAGQIDEMHLAMSPVLLGEGESLF